MTTTALCQICSTASAVESCQLCGQRVCRDHYDRTDEACLECATGGDVGEQTFR